MDFYLIVQLDYTINHFLESKKRTIKKVEMYGIEIPISTYRTQGAITFKVLSLKHTEISASRYFLCYKIMPLENALPDAAGCFL